MLHTSSRRRPIHPGLALIALVASCANMIDSAASATIGASGGSVSVNEGAARGAGVAIPAGAVSGNVTITIHADPMITDTPTEGRAVSPVVVFGPEGQTFATPVTITIPTTSAANALFTRPGGSTGAWALVPGAHYEAAQHAIVADVMHFSEFVGVAVDGTDASVCAADSDCPAGTRCVSGACTAGTPTDAGTDGGSDASTDSGTDAEVDAGGDGSVDVIEPTDSGTDAATDGGFPTDSGTDASTDGGVPTDGGVASCVSDTDCPSGTSCVAGACMPVDGGVTDGGVPTDSGVTDGGVPTDSGTVDAGPPTDAGSTDAAVDAPCASDADCPAGHACVAGVCV